MKQMISITFTNISQKDISFVQALAHETWQETYKEILSPVQIKYMLNTFYAETEILKEIENGRIWHLISSENQPIAYLSYAFEDNCVFLSKIYMKTAFQGKGIAQQMLDKVFAFAKENKATSIHLRVHKKNTKAQNFYEKMGFIKTAEDIKTIGDGFVMDDYIYTRKV